jgi:hypothetical protein
VDGAAGAAHAPTQIDIASARANFLIGPSYCGHDITYRNMIKLPLKGGIPQTASGECQRANSGTQY